MNSPCHDGREGEQRGKGQGVKLAGIDCGGEAHGVDDALPQHRASLESGAVPMAAREDRESESNFKGDRNNNGNKERHADRVPSGVTGAS